MIKKLKVLKLKGRKMNKENEQKMENKEKIVVIYREPY